MQKHDARNQIVQNGQSSSPSNFLSTNNWGLLLMTEIRKPVQDLLTDYDIFEPGFVKDPYPSFSEIRESGCPIARTERYEGS